MRSLLASLPALVLALIGVGGLWVWSAGPAPVERPSPERSASPTPSPSAHPPGGSETADGDSASSLRVPSLQQHSGSRAGTSPPASPRGLCRSNTGGSLPTSKPSVLAGRVLSTSGRRLPGARVIASSPTVTCNARTQSGGWFVLEVPPGQYDLRIALSGYAARKELSVSLPRPTTQVFYRVDLSPVSAVPEGSSADTTSSSPDPRGEGPGRHPFRASPRRDSPPPESAPGVFVPPSPRSGSWVQVTLCPLSMPHPINAPTAGTITPPQRRTRLEGRSIPPSPPVHATGPRAIL
jgi:hypothetical protein